MPVSVYAQVSTSVSSLEREFNAITQNLANLNTVGYKRIVSSFSKSLDSQNLSSSGDDASTTEVEMNVDFSQGLSLIGTGRSLDVAISGDGFFVVEDPSGVLYTRNGSFKINQNSQLVDSNGRVVQGQGGPITIGDDANVSSITIGRDGTVGSVSTEYGKLKVVRFPEGAKGIQPAGDSCFYAPEDVKPVAADSYAIHQGSLESSNVKMVDELVNMIMVSRLYEANMKFMTAKKEASNNLMSVAMG